MLEASTQQPVDRATTRHLRRSLPQIDYNRCAQTIRVLRLAVMLRSRWSSIADMAIAMNVTTRTIRRDLIVIDAIGFPLTQDDERKEWKVVGPSPLTDGR